MLMLVHLKAVGRLSRVESRKRKAKRLRRPLKILNVYDRESKVEKLSQHQLTPQIQKLNL
jgi:hypothetical protein